MATQHVKGIVGALTKLKGNFCYITAKIWKMEKLLAAHFNIKTVKYLDDRGIPHFYAFNNKMLANDIIIEYYTVDTPKDKRKRELKNPHFQLPETEMYGTQLIVTIKYDNKYFQFVMFELTYEIGSPIMILQTITFLVKLIEETEPDELINYLSEISTAHVFPHEFPDQAFIDLTTKMLQGIFHRVHDLIELNNVGLN